MRVVLDTNVWVSGLLWTGAPWRVVRLVEQGRIEACATPAMLEEVLGVLARPKFQRRRHQLDLSPEELRGYLTAMVTLVPDIPVRPDEPPIVTADRDDDIFLLCALAVGAECVVSGDKPLLDIDEHRGIPILSVNDFLTRFFPDGT